MSHVIHVVIEGGVVAEDIYVGPFRYQDLAEDKAEAIERAADRADIGLACMVRPLLPGSTSARAIIEATE
jgi:hypothetical protein